MTDTETQRTMESTAASSLRSIKDITRDLSKPVQQRHLKSRKQGGSNLQYIPWHYAIKYLDFYASGWSYEVRNIAAIGKDCVVTVRLSIPCSEGIIHREATGRESLECKGYGDPVSNASSMALRRAAAHFGLCLYLYDK